MARPNKGLGHVDGLQGDPESKWRLKVVLSTLTGEMLVDEAYDELGVGPTQFSNLRKQVLQGALDGLQPKPVGRPVRVTTLSEQEVEVLRQRGAELEHENAILHTRLELAALLAPRQTRRSKSGGQTAAPGKTPRSATARRAVP